MLRNHYNIDENMQVSAFLKTINDKKNSHYIILDTIPKSFIDIRTIALKAGNLQEKLKNLKKRISNSKTNDVNKNINFLIESGDRLIETKDGFFDFINTLNEILKTNAEFLNDKIGASSKKEIYALNENDKISAAKNVFLQKRINILPVIKDLKVIGELRPIDLLVGSVFEKNNTKATILDEKSKMSVHNLPISNFINKKPLTLTNNNTIRDAAELMINKKIPSVIIVDNNDNLYSICSYKDIFKHYKNNNEQENYSINFVGQDILYPDEFDLIQDFAEKTIKKISNISDYNELKITLKQIGEKDSGHKKKLIAKFLLAKGNNVLQVEKEIITGTSDEEHDNKVKGNWNIPQLIQEGLSILEKKVKEQKKKINNIYK